MHTAINLPLQWKVGQRADKWVLKQIARRHLPPGLIWRRKMGFPLPLAHDIAPLAVPAFFTGGFCENELGLGRRGIERLLADWRRWTFGVFGLLDARDVGDGCSPMGETVDHVAHRIAKLERAAVPGRPVSVPASVH